MKLPYYNTIDIETRYVDPQTYSRINVILGLPELNHGLFLPSVTEVSQTKFTIQGNSNINIHHLYAFLCAFMPEATIYCRIEHKDNDMTLIHKYKNKEHTTTSKSYWRQYILNDRESAIEELTEAAPNMYEYEVKQHPLYMYLSKTEKQNILSISLPF